MRGSCFGSGRPWGDLLESTITRDGSIDEADPDVPTRAGATAAFDATIGITDAELLWGANGLEACPLMSDGGVVAANRYSDRSIGAGVDVRCGAALPVSTT